MNLRDKFIANGIPYDEIDIEMIGLIDVLNFGLGLKTKYCCYGHDDINRDTYVILDDSVTDDDIQVFMDKMGNEFFGFDLYKWVRQHDGWCANWKIKTRGFHKDHNGELKKKSLDYVVEELWKLV